MKLSDEEIQFLLEKVNVDDPHEHCYVVSTPGEDHVVQVLEAGTAVECLQFIAEHEFPDTMNFITHDNFEAMEPQLMRLN